ncbi:hypothetical protein L249_4770, partial [Ophiocordyceps polyrhachis-furcata BCC 54312]
MTGRESAMPPAVSNKRTGLRESEDGVEGKCWSSGEATKQRHPGQVRCGSGESLEFQNTTASGLRARSLFGSVGTTNFRWRIPHDRRPLFAVTDSTPMRILKGR